MTSTRSIARSKRGRDQLPESNADEDDGRRSQEEMGEDSVQVPAPILQQILDRLDHLEGRPAQHIRPEAEYVTAASDEEYSDAAVNPTTRNPGPQKKVPDPEKPRLLETNVTLEQFAAWRKGYEDYVDCTGLDTLPLKQQLARFRGFLSTDMKVELVHAVGIQDTDLIPVDQVLDRIQSYVRDRVNVAVDRVRFEERKQLSGESFDQFLIGLRRIAANADLCRNCFDERLATRVMAGISDAETKRKLLALRPFPSLSKVIDVCRSEECSRENADLLNDGRVVQKADIRQKSGLRDQSQSRDGRSRCTKCGSSRHQKGELCPAKNKKCNTCGKLGHFSRECRSRNKPWDVGGSGRSERKVQRVRLNVSSARSRTPKAPKISISLHHGITSDWVGDCQATPDTGSEGTIAGIDIMRYMGIDEMNLHDGENADLIAANGKKIECVGWATYEFKSKGQQAKDKVYFCRGLRGLLLPWYVCLELGILPPSYPEPMQTAVQAVDVTPEFQKPRQKLEEIEKVVGRIPDDPSEAEVNGIKEKLLVHFSDVFDSSETLKPMKCPPLKIHLEEGAVPFSLKVPRKVPIPLRPGAKKELNKLVAQGITEKVGDEPTEWCHGLVLAPKPNGEVRICVDLTKLNKYVKRPVHPFQSPKEAVSDIPSKAKWFTVMDATKGYFQMELDKESQKYTVFITPEGRYRFLRAPMGLACTGDEFCRQGDLAFEGIGNLRKVVDDTLEYDELFREHILRVWKTLEVCREKSITLNGKKMQFAQHEVKFVGYIVGVDGVKADPKKVAAIQDYPTPKNVTDLRCFFGIVNQVSEFSAEVAQAAQGLRPLLSTKNEFVWSHDQESSFQRVKKALLDTPALAQFELGAETVLQTDASRKGLGFVLQQKKGQKWRPVMYGSRFLSDAESRYAVIELEMLAAAWAMDKCKLYLRGLPSFTLLTDHKPLVPILNDYTMDNIDNPRLLNLKGKVAGYVFHASWIKGKDHAVPDALSRAPHSHAGEDDLTLEGDVKALAIRSVEIAAKGAAIEDVNLQKIKDANSTDSECQALMAVISAGVPAKWENRWPGALPYKKIVQDISVVDGMFMVGSRIVIPKSLRKKMLSDLHLAHQGVDKTKQRARSCLYWPGMNSDIENTIGSCLKCQQDRSSLPKEPIIQTATPEWVFQDVSADLFSHAGNHYMVYVDRLSGWPIVAFFGKRDPNTAKVIRKLEKYFTDLGVPLRIRTDNGPQFASAEFGYFLKEWGVQHSPSSPHYPQSNGHAEAGVKAMKRLICKTDVTETTSFRKALLEYRNCPLTTTGKSPAEMLFGHPIRSNVPMHRSKFSAQWTAVRKEAEGKNAKYKERQQENYNWSAKKLSRFLVGDEVFLQDHRTRKWDKAGIIVKAKDDERSYLVKLPSGSVYWRNRRFLRKSLRSDEQQEPLEETQEKLKPALRQKSPDDTYKSVKFEGEKASNAESTKELRKGTRNREKTKFYQAPG